MRRTLFAFPRDLLPAVWGSASARVAAQLQHAARQGGRGAAGSPATATPWLSRTFEAVLRTLAEDGPATTAELRERIPALAGGWS